MLIPFQRLMMKKAKQEPSVKGFKYRIYPTKEQKEYLAQVFGSTRFTYNHFLASIDAQYKDHLEHPELILKPRTDAFSLCYQLKPLKEAPETSWLAGMPSHVIQAAVGNVATAYDKFFKGLAKHPKFKSKLNKQSAEYSRYSYRLKGNSLFLAKCDMPFKVRWSRDLPTDEPGPCTVSKTPSGQYYVSFSCEYIPKKTSGTGVVGVDAGIATLATIADGESITAIPNPRHYVKAQDKLAKLSKELAHKQKGSKNREKARIKLAKHHEYIANCRNDYLHKLTTSLIRENQAVGIESLLIKNIAKNHKLAKHILDAGWGMMREQLKYKAVASQHCFLILADPKYPSTQLCSCCGRKPTTKIELGVTRWQCEHCGSIHERDPNAAMNLEILARSKLHEALMIKSEALIILAERYHDYAYELQSINVPREPWDLKPVEMAKHRLCEAGNTSCEAGESSDYVRG